jgi:hypothetical protein
MAFGPYIEVTLVGGAAPLLIQDIVVNDLGRGRAGGSVRAGGVYVPTTGTLELFYSSDVAASYESGVLRGFIDRGLITALFKVGSEMHRATQEWFGFMDYNDLGTIAAPLALVADTWTPLTNDGLGPQTTKTWAPTGVEELWDTVGNALLFDDLTVGDVLLFRADFTVTPTVNNARLSVRLNFPAFGGFQLTKGLSSLDEGAGVAYPRVETLQFYIGSEQVLAAGATIEVLCSAAASVTVNGFFIKHF